jgi:Protein of unknown function (DUF4019)
LKAAHHRWLVAIFSASAALSVHAQSGGESADELLNDAKTVTRQIDNGEYADVWANAAPFMKARIMQDQFVADTRRARQTLGPVRAREWSSVTRLRSRDMPGVPDGLYANVDVATTMATGSAIYEKLSFRFDDDGHWHLTGYVPRQMASVDPAIGRLQESGKDGPRQGAVIGAAGTLGPIRISRTVPQSNELNAAPPSINARVVPESRRTRVAPVHRTAPPTLAAHAASTVHHATSKSYLPRRTSTSNVHKPEHRG